MATSKTTLYLDADEYRQLQRLARERGTSAALLIREAVAEYTARNIKTRRPRSIGMGRSGRATLGADAEKLLKGFGSEE
jgi:predicted transcriptional regulator